MIGRGLFTTGDAFIALVYEVSATGLVDSQEF